MVPPCIRWPGSKTRLAPTIVDLLGPHDTYIEPYFGSGAVLLAKPRSAHEIVNDLDGEVTNFYRILRDRPDELIELCLLTPCHEQEWRDARNDPDQQDPVERARQFFVRSNQTYGSSENGGWIPGYGHGGKASGLGHKWVRALGRLGPVTERLQGVQVTSRDALTVLRDTIGVPRTAVYLDPPYLPDTVTKNNHYRERDGLTTEHHIEMLNLAQHVDGTVVISHYAHELYETALTGWRKITIDMNHTGNPKTRNTKLREKKTEILWVNREEHTLF